jgi:hypothetical protein
VFFTPFANNNKQQNHGFGTFVELIWFKAQFRISFMECIFMNFEQDGQSSVVKPESPYFFEFFLF